MGKISGAYASVIRGVSQQIPELRLDGQHAEQINMLSDPVTGLARRRGTTNILEVPFSFASNAATIADHRSLDSRSFSIATTDYSLLFRTQAKPVGSLANALYCYNKTANVNVPIATHGTDAEVLPILDTGIAAMTQVGRLVLLAGKTQVAVGTANDLFGADTNKRYASVWVRGGIHSRTFKITVSRTGLPDVVAMYTTPQVSYPGTLDTSGILAFVESPPGSGTFVPEASYQKNINDAVNAYNSAVTAWIGYASGAIQPANIAAQLAAGITAGGIACGVVGSHVVIEDAALTGVSVDDGGDGSLLRGVHQSVTEAAMVSTVHVAGKIVQVQAKEGDPVYYLKAIPVRAGATGWQEVTWQEAAGATFTAGTWFLLGTVEAGTFYVASTPAKLKLLIPSLTIPEFGIRAVGDAESNKAPYFVTRVINYLGTFQDRLVVGSSGVISMSEVGNYFNFFRTSVLTVVDSDPVEVYALGSEADTIRHGIIFDKSLLLFGDKQQYSISGKVPVTPATTAVIQSSAHEGATDARPVVAGDLVFYLKQREGTTQAYQIAIGNVQDTTNSDEITQQLSSYMLGVPCQLMATTTPNMILARTTGNFSRLYSYRYLDAPGQGKRLLDSWSTWEFSPLLGDLVSTAVYKDTALLFFMRTGIDAGGVPRTWLAVDRASLLPTLDSKPYLDSARPYSAVIGGLSTRCWHTQAGLSTAYDNTTTAYLQGDSELSRVPGMITEFPAIPTSGLWTGTELPSYVELTNPVIRDKKDVAIVGGRLTITKCDVSYRDTAALDAQVITAYSDDVALQFNGRVLGAANNLIGIQPVSRGSVPVMVGREVREYRLRLKSRAWYPMTITGIEWTGQYFYNTSRA